MSIKNIILDLGGVILNIDYQLTINAFKSLGASGTDELFMHIEEHDLVSRYETGQLSTTDFRQLLQSQLQIKTDDQVFDQAWNAMLVDLPKERLAYILQLKKKYNLFLFSNTNELHLIKFNQICREAYGIYSFDDYFNKMYYSHTLGYRKPDPQGFHTIITENNLSIFETLFVDDSLTNIEGARSMGLNAHHITQEKTLLTLFDDVPSA